MSVGVHDIFPGVTDSDMSKSLLFRFFFACINSFSDDDQAGFVGSLADAINNAGVAMEIDIESLNDPVMDVDSDSSLDEPLYVYHQRTKVTIKSTAKSTDDWTSDETGSSFSQPGQSELESLANGSEGSDIPYLSGDVDSDRERIRVEPNMFKAGKIAEAEKLVRIAKRALKAAQNMAGEGDLLFASFEIVSYADFPPITTVVSDDEPEVATVADSTLSLRRYTRSTATLPSTLPATKRKAEFQPPTRFGKKPKSKIIVSSDSAKARSLASEGESEVDNDSDVVVVAAPKGKGKAKAKNMKKTKDAKEPKKPLSRALGPYDPEIHTKYDDRCNVCSPRDPNDFCYYITANIAGTRRHYEARRLAKHPVLNRPNHHSCVRCINGHKGDCISPPHRSIVGPDYMPGHAYYPGVPMVKSYFLHKFLGRDEDGNMLPDFPYDLAEIKAASCAAFPTEPDITKPQVKVGGRRVVKGGAKAVAAVKVKKVAVVEITVNPLRKSSRATVPPAFVEGSSGRPMDVNEAAAPEEEEDAEVDAE